MDIKTELLNKLADAPIHEAILNVHSIMPSNKFLIGLKANSKRLRRTTIQMKSAVLIMAWK